LIPYFYDIYTIAVAHKIREQMIYIPQNAFVKIYTPCEVLKDICPVAKEDLGSLPYEIRKRAHKT
jgi:hypothetical protein